MVKFADLKTGDKIARRMPKLVGDTLTHFHGETHTVCAATTHYAQRSLMTRTALDFEYWMHDLQFSTIDDELARWDIVG